MEENLLNQIKNAEIEVMPYNSKSRSLPTEQEKIQRRESLLKSGLINPIVITEDENHNPLIVDGYLRYELICELKGQNKWSDFPIAVLQIPLDKSKDYRNIQTNHKNYTKIQLAIFGAYNYWDEVEKNSLLRQKQGKKANYKKGKTSEIVGNISGVSEKYAEYAHILLSISRNFFYKIFFLSRLSMKKNEIKDLITIYKNNPEHAKEIVTEMKKIFVRESNLADSNAQKTIYERAKKTWENNKNTPAEKLIGKLTASESETEEVKNVLITKTTDIKAATSIDFCKKTKENFDLDRIEKCDLDTNDSHEVTKNFYTVNSGTKPDRAKVSLLKRQFCAIVISKPLPEDIQILVKEIIENNIAYEVGIKCISDEENI